MNAAILARAFCSEIFFGLTAVVAIRGFFLNRVPIQFTPACQLPTA
jgi:hypothetical protein